MPKLWHGSNINWDIRNHSVNGSRAVTPVPLLVSIEIASVPIHVVFYRDVY